MVVGRWLSRTAQWVFLFFFFGVDGFGSGCLPPAVVGFF